MVHLSVVTALQESRVSMDAQLAEKMVLNYVPPGTRVRLREEVYSGLKEREWIFRKVKHNKVFLIHKTENYGIVVEIEDIDWALL